MDIYLLASRINSQEFVTDLFHTREENNLLKKMHERPKEEEIFGELHALIAKASYELATKGVDMDELDSLIATWTSFVYTLEDVFREFSGIKEPK